MTENSADSTADLTDAQEGNHADELAVVEHEGILMAVGPGRSVQRFMESIDAGEAASNSMSPAALRTVSAVAGLASAAQESSGAWVKLTPESTARFRQLSATNRPKDGLFSGVIRGEKGRIDQHARFHLPKSGSVNPLMLANVTTIAASFAAAAAEEEMRDLLAGIDRKLDALIADRRSEVIGATRGVTEVMDEAFTHYQHAGEVGETAWSKVQSVQPQVLGTWHRGLDQLKTQMDKVQAARPIDRDDELRRLNDDVLTLWLPVLGQCLVTLTRFRVLEQARVDQVELHLSESHRVLSEERHHALLEGLKTTVQSLLTGASTALDVPNRVRVAHPLQVAKMHDAAASVRTQSLDFAERVD
ncbi:hypothetical protein [Micrococcus terreus]|uniref:hypothetical protein n=1 Tax=Micrococcus terreus TaxID=574650 RepID=UPI003D702A00